MPDAHQDTAASTTNEVIEQALSSGLQTFEDDEKQVAKVRARAQCLATALVASALANDVAALHAFAAEIMELDPDGAGVAGAAEHLTSMRLYGLPPMGLVSTAVIGVVPAAGTDAATGTIVHEQLGWPTAERLATNIWTGRATGDTERYVRGMAQLRDAPANLVDDVLHVMAVDVAGYIDTYEGWRVEGYEELERYRAEHPVPDRPVSDRAIPAPAAGDAVSSGAGSAVPVEPTMLITAS